MAPDINSLPSSPRATRPQPARTSSHTEAPSHSRSTSQQMPPPPVPIQPRSPTIVSNEQIPLPIRHPRPMTAAELYLECEKEQEAVVNRLTRELTALRAQSASVASNTSHSSTSTSASLLPVDISDPNPAHQLTGATHPTPSRRHRSSSSLSARSIPTTPATSQAPSSTTGTSTQAQAGSVNIPVVGQSQASFDRAAAAAQNPSRQPSITASGTSTPARSSLDIARNPLPHRPSLSRDPSYHSQSTTLSSTAAHAGTPLPLSPTHSITSAHYTETAAYRSEMEVVKAENEALRQRVRTLERALRARRRDSSNSDRVPRERDSAVSPGIPGAATVAAWDGGVGGVAPPRERSESQSTTASSRRGIGAGVEDEVRLGESAGSVGVGRGV